MMVSLESYSEVPSSSIISNNNNMSYSCLSTAAIKHKTRGSSSAGTITAHAQSHGSY